MKYDFRRWSSVVSKREQGFGKENLVEYLLWSAINQHYNFFIEAERHIWWFFSRFNKRRLTSRSLKLRGAIKNVERQNGSKGEYRGKRGGGPSSKIICRRVLIRELRSGIYRRSW